MTRRERFLQKRRTRQRSSIPSITVTRDESGFTFKQPVQGPEPDRLLVAYQNMPLLELTADVVREGRRCVAQARISSAQLELLVSLALERARKAWEEDPLNVQEEVPSTVNLTLFWQYPSGAGEPKNIEGYVVEGELQPLRVLKKKYPEGFEGLSLSGVPYTGLSLSKRTRLPAQSFIALKTLVTRRLATESHPEGEEVDHPTFAAVRGDVNGLVLLTVGAARKVSITAFADAVYVDSGKIKVNGRITVLAGSLSEAVLVWRSHSTGIAFESQCSIDVDQSWTEADAGRVTYRYRAETEFDRAQWSEMLTSDIYNAYIRTVNALDGSVTETRLARVPYLARLMRTTGTHSSDVGVISIVPYFTFKAKALSARIEVFREQVEDLITPTREVLRGLRHSSPSKPVWLIGELPYKAQDNGASFYNWVREHHAEIDAYYVLDKGSPDLRNLHDRSHVIDHGSRRHFELALQAQNFIGTHSAEYIYPSRNPEFLKHLNASRVFLQHGVMGTKWMADLYGKSAANFGAELFCVSSEFEKSYIVSDFGFEPNEVVVTGLSRFDRLLQGQVAVKPRSLLIIPTWRDWLHSAVQFEDSQYYLEWHSLIASERFAEIVERYQLDVTFYLHANMQRFSNSFEDLPVRVVHQGEENVQDLMLQHAVMLTDYSSVGFDFSFQQRPVIYYQFDAEQFFGSKGSHILPDKDLPGHVVRSGEQVLNTLESLAESGFRQPDSLRERSNRFIDYRDTDNSARVFRAIRDLTAPGKHVSTASHVDSEAFAYEYFRRSGAYFPLMKTFYRVARLLPRKKGLVMFESHNGRQISDSPRAIYESLVELCPEARKVWILNTSPKFRDANTSAVKRLSPRYYWLMARAEAWVMNQSAPVSLRRPVGTYYLQTWHGTPLKRMQHDAISSEGRSDSYLEERRKATAQWSALLSPSPFATGAFRSAFRYRGPVHELGYPRNDSLVLRNNFEGIRDARQKIGLSPGQRAVLYAPTFRDNVTNSAGRFKFVLPFKIESFLAEVPEDTVLLLRLHSVVSGRVRIPKEYRHRVRDVTRYDEINDLLVASDVVITDYSSLFFDAAVLRRPIILYAYDLVEYRDELRGFYLEYEEVAPGPIVKTEPDLWRVVNKALDGRLSLQSRDAFLRRFAPRDDGRAAQRVVQELLIPHLGIDEVPRTQVP